MNDSERLKAVINYKRISTNKFAKAIGLASQKLYAIKKGDYGITSETADAITRKFKEINYEWLINGEGEMIIHDQVSESHIVYNRPVTIKELSDKIDKLERKCDYIEEIMLMLLKNTGREKEDGAGIRKNA